MYLIVNSEGDLSKLQQVKNNKNILVWYYADWCGHCQMMKDEWEKVVKSNPNVNLAKVSDNYVKPEDNIMGFPTLKLFKSEKTPKNSAKLGKGKEPKIIDYQGSRDADSLLKFIKENVKGKNKAGSLKRKKKAGSLKRKKKKARKNTRKKKN